MALAKYISIFALTFLTGWHWQKKQYLKFIALNNSDRTFEIGINFLLTELVNRYLYEQIWPSNERTNPWAE